MFYHYIIIIMALKVALINLPNISAGCTQIFASQQHLLSLDYYCKDNMLHKGAVTDTMLLSQQYFIFLNIFSYYSNFRLF